MSINDYDSRKDSFGSFNVAVNELRAKLLRERCPAAKRVEVIGDCELYLGNCIEIMPTLDKVDAVLTDPPYGIDYGNAGGFSESSGWKDWRGKAEWDKNRPSEDAFRLMLSISSNQIIWGGNYFTDMLPPTMQWLVWDKGQRNFTLADCEFAWSSQKRAARVFDYSRAKAAQDGKVHPTQKPVELMIWCIDQIRWSAGSFLDPYMGSATTGVACVKSGRRFIGVEIDETYFNIACDRIRKAYAQPDMFIAPPTPAPTQEMMDI